MELHIWLIINSAYGDMSDRSFISEWHYDFENKSYSVTSKVECTHKIHKWGYIIKQDGVRRICRGYKKGEPRNNGNLKKYEPAVWDKLEELRLDQKYSIKEQKENQSGMDVVPVSAQRETRDISQLNLFKVLEIDIKSTISQSKDALNQKYKEWKINAAIEGKEVIIEKSEWMDKMYSIVTEKKKYKLYQKSVRVAQIFGEETIILPELITYNGLYMRLCEYIATKEIYIEEEDEFGQIYRANEQSYHRKDGIIHLQRVETKSASGETITGTFDGVLSHIKDKYELRDYSTPQSDQKFITDCRGAKGVLKRCKLYRRWTGFKNGVVDHWLGKFVSIQQIDNEYPNEFVYTFMYFDIQFRDSQIKFIQYDSIPEFNKKKLLEHLDTINAGDFDQWLKGCLPNPNDRVAILYHMGRIWTDLEGGESQEMLYLLGKTGLGKSVLVNLIASFVCKNMIFKLSHDMKYQFAWAGIERSRVLVEEETEKDIGKRGLSRGMIIKMLDGGGIRVHKKTVDSFETDRQLKVVMAGNIFLIVEGEEDDKNSISRRQRVFHFSDHNVTNRIPHYHEILLENNTDKIFAKGIMAFNISRKWIEKDEKKFYLDTSVPENEILRLEYMREQKNREEMNYFRQKLPLLNSEWIEDMRVKKKQRLDNCDYAKESCHPNLEEID